MLVKKIWCIDTHTAGEPTRILVSPLPRVKGSTVVEAKDILRSNFDDVRRMLMCEPRGHRDMFGAIILPPRNPSADLGVVFMDNSGYLNMCVHGSIGVTTAAIETGIIEMREPVTDVTLETPSGIVKAAAKIEESRVAEVSLVNVPSFFYQEGKIVIPGVGEIHIDIAFGGNFFAIVDAEELNISIRPDSYDILVRSGMQIKNLTNKTFQVQHPVDKHIRSVDLVEICDKSSDANVHNRNATIFGTGQMDRSPCGTGTCAKMAALHAKGKLKLGEEFINESILGTRFKGKLLAETTVGKFKAVVPEITGSAYITAFSIFTADRSDPFKNGFVL